MNGRAVRPTYVSDAIVVDEVGLESGVYGRYRLRSSYQPIFERLGRLLVPVAVEGLISPHLAGRAGPAAAVLRRDPGQRQAVHREHVPGAASAQSSQHRRRAAGALFQLRSQGQRRSREVAERDPLHGAPAGRDRARSKAPGLRDHRSGGARIRACSRPLPPRCAAMGSGWRSTISAPNIRRWRRIGLIRPDIVKVDGAWFRTLCREPAAIRLFATVVAGFRQSGAKVLIEGIEEPAHLANAIAAGADLFQGFLLGRPALVGTRFRRDAAAACREARRRSERARAVWLIDQRR